MYNNSQNVLYSFVNILYLNLYIFIYFISIFSIYSDQMKRSSSKPSSPSSIKKNTKDQIKIHVKIKNKKSCQHTASTLGSRSSMDSKLTRRKQLTSENSQKYSRGNHMRSRTPLSNLRSLNIPLDSDNSHTFVNFNNEQLISFREYCMVGNRWIPLITQTQRERLTNPVHAQIKQSNVSILNNTPLQQEYPKLNQQQNARQVKLQTIFQSLQEKIENKQIIQQISSQNKSYYYSILKNALEKFQLPQEDISRSRVKDTNSHANSIHQKDPQNQQNCNQTYENEKIQQISPVKSLKMQEQPETILNTSDIIKLRELKQLGYISKLNLQQTEPPKPDSLNTSLTSINEYLSNLILTIKNQGYTSQLVDMLKMAWGCPKKQKLYRLRNNQFLGSTREVLPDYLFQINQDFIGKSSFFEFIHNKCMFDCINKQFNKLKPFYESNGETFPWNFKLSSPLTFFQINQNTINMAFDQIRTKLLQKCSYLCGTIVQLQPCHPQYHLLTKRREEREQFMLKKQLQKDQNRIHEQNSIQNQCTLVLLTISQDIFLGLIEQFRQFIIL